MHAHTISHAEKRDVCLQVSQALLLRSHPHVVPRLEHQPLGRLMPLLNILTALRSTLTLRDLNVRARWATQTQQWWCR